MVFLKFQIKWKKYDSILSYILHTKMAILDLYFEADYSNQNQFGPPKVNKFIATCIHEKPY